MIGKGREMAWRLAWCMVLALGVAPAVGAAASADRPLSLPEAVARVRLGVGAVGSYNPASRPPVVFSASGFFVDESGHFLTANHAIAAITKRHRLEDLRVFLPSDQDRQGHRARVVAREPRFDLAVLKVEGGDYVPLELGDSARVREGQRVAICGFPFGFLLGLHPSTSAGIISSVCPVAVPAINARLLDPEVIAALREPYNIFQLDVTAYPGHSGAPLFDATTARVIGVVSSAHIRKTKEKVISSGFTYAIPIAVARKLLERVRRERK